MSSADQAASDDANKPPKEAVESNCNAFVEAKADQGDPLR